MRHRSGRPRGCRTAASTSTGWARRRAAARPSARRSTSSRATRSRRRPASGSCTCSSRRRATRSPTAARTSATRTSSDVPLRGLLSDGFAATRRALIEETAAPGAVPPGDPWPFDGALGLLLAGAPSTRRASRRRTSASPTAGGTSSRTRSRSSRRAGAGLVVPGWGFLLNNELTDFDYALLHHPNSVAGGKRPRSSMAPTIVTQAATAADGRLAGRLDDHHDRAAAAPRPARRGDDAAAGDRRPARVAAERRHDAAEPAFRASPLAAALEARGHRFVTRPRSAPRPGSSSCRPAGWSRPQSRPGAAAAARWWRRRCPNPSGRAGERSRRTPTASGSLPSPLPAGGRSRPARAR